MDTGTLLIITTTAGRAADPLADRRADMEKRFNPRVSGVIFRQRHVLLSRGRSDAFWALPGGRIELGEPSDRALRREIAEELGAEDAKIDRLLFVVENRFAHGRTRFHEIGFYYRVALPEDSCPLRPDEFPGAEPDLILRWFALNAVAGLDIRPAFLRRQLAALPNGIEHLQVDEWA